MKHTLLVLAFSLVLATPVGASPARAVPAAPAPRTVQTPAGPVSELTLENGLKVILKENRAAPVVSWVVTYGVGSRDEKLGMTGSAHLLEHMLFKGTKTLGKGQVAQLLSRNGAAFNASTGQDVTNYYETYASDRLELGLMIESARMRGALIKDTERQSEMTVVRNELERGESEPESVLYHEIWSAAFKAHPYHHPVIGWRSDVEGVATSQLKHFYDTYYHPGNAVAVLVGDFKTAEAIPLVKKYFGDIPRGPKPPAVITKEEAQLGERRVRLDRRGETSLVHLAFHVPPVTSPDIAPLVVLDTILSSGVSDRLHQALVEKQLATSAWAFTAQNRDPGLFYLGATIRPGVSHEAVEKAILDEIETLKREPVPAAELQKAKNQAEANLIYANESTSQLAESLGRYQAIAGAWDRGFKLIDQIKAVTPADVRRVATTYLAPTNRTVGWYVATPDGPVPPRPENAGGGKAVANEGKVAPAGVQPFERRASKPRQLTKPVRRILANGLTVLVLENHAAPTVAVSGFVRAGGALDPKGRAGLAALTANMLEAGTARRTKLQLATDLESVAASIGFGPGTESVSISGKMLAEDVDLGLTAVAEMLRTPSFPGAELDKLKARAIAGIRQAEDSPETRAARAFAQAVYPESHPYYQHDPAARIGMLERIGVDDLRRFHARHYGPNTTTLVVVGDVKAERVVAKLDSLFSGWAPAERRAVAAGPVAPTPAHVHTVPMPDKTNVEVIFGHAGSITRKSPNYYAALLANDILGGDTLSSRIGVRLRDEMGLTYGVYSGFSATTLPGAWTASVTTNASNVDTALAALRKEIAGFLAKGVTPQELEFAKSGFIGSQAVRLTTNAGMAGSLSSIEFYDLGLDYWSRYPAIIQGVTLAAVNRAARDLVKPSGAHVVIAGPVGK